MLRCVAPMPPLAVMCCCCVLLAGCDVLETSDDVQISDRRVELPDRFDDEVEQEISAAVAPGSNALPAPQPEPMVELPPIVLPPALVGGVTECIVDGVIFRATECYRTGRGFRLTIYCGSNEQDATLIFNTGQCVVNGAPSGQGVRLAILDGPHVAERIDLPRGEVIWFQLEPPRLPIDDTNFDSVTIAFDSQSTIKSNVEFFGIPVTGDALPNLPLEEKVAIPQRLERMLATGLQCQTVWRFNDFLGDTILSIDAFDPATRAIRGHFYDAVDRDLAKHFEGSLAADGMSFQIKTIRGSGIRNSGTAVISDTNLYLMQQETNVTFHLVRADLLGVSTDGVAFSARLPADVVYQ